MKRNAQGVNIKKVSVMHTTFEDGGVPTDITKEEVKDWERQRSEAGPLAALIPIDVPFSSCWLGKKLREMNKFTVEELDTILFDHGRRCMTISEVWRTAAQTYASLK